MAVDHSTTKNWTPREFSTMKTEIDFEAETDYSCSSNTHEEHELSDNIPSRVNERANINIIEMYEQASSEYRAFFVYEDLFSRYVVLRALKKEPGSANVVAEIAKNLIGIFSLVGAPRILESSNERSLAEKLVQELRNRIPSLEMVHGNISRKKYIRRDWKTLIQSWQIANPLRLWHEGLHIIQVHENTCNFSSSQGETSRNSPAEVFFQANLANDLVLSVSNTNSIEVINTSIPSPLLPNKFMDSDDKKENVDSYNLINNMKNEVISVTEKNPIDEAGYESWTEEEWPIKIEPCKSPVPPPTSSDQLIDSNDIGQNVDSSNLINSVNEVLPGTEKDSIDTKKRDVSNNDIFRCIICDRIFGRMCNLKNHMRSHKTTLKNKGKYASDAFPEETLNITHDKNLEDITNSRTKSRMNVRKENDSIESEINPRRHSSRISLSSNKKTIQLGKFKNPEKKTYQCDIRGKNYPSTYTLRRHMSASHQRKKIYKCEICAKTFNFSSTLTIHKLVHSDEQPFQCHLCEKRCKRKSDLNSHQLIHSGVKPFECDECKRTFKLKRFLRYHIISDHGNIGPFKCDVCNKTFTRKQGLQHHIASAHNGIRPFKCDICNIAFASNRSLQHHIAAVHKNIKPFKCDICKKTFTSKQSVRYHIVSGHGNIRPFNCDICKKTFTSKQSVRYHIVSGHGNIRPFKCDICKATFTQKASLQYHIVSGHGNIRSFKCEICKATFGQKQRLQCHITSVHEGIRPFKCNICKVAFTRKDNLKLHIASVHKKIKLFKCEICKKAFASKESLRNHIVAIHEDIRSFKCDICKATFNLKYQLVKHIASVHKKIKPFKCDICKKTFSSKPNIRHHITSVHQKIKPFKCDICKNTFAGNQGLRYHIASVHNGLKPFKCNTCNNTFSRKPNLQHHIASVHNGIKPFKCDICNITFTKKYGLRRHTVRLHTT